MRNCLLIAFAVHYVATISAVQEDVLEVKVHRLLEMSSRNPVIALNMESYRTFIDLPMRNYSFVVLLTTTNPKRECGVCIEAVDEFQIVASSWKFSQQYDSRIFFGIVDFDIAPDVFQMLKQQTAPAILFVSPKGSSQNRQFLDINNVGFSADAIAAWIYQNTGIKIRIFHPPNYTGVLALILFMATGAAALWFQRISLDSLYNRSIWCILAMATIFCGISGQVYNQIRGPPMMNMGRDGQLALIYPSSNFQFIAETFIVLALYLATTAGILCINYVGELSEENKGKKKLYIIGGVTLYTIAFSALLSVFRMKFRGYPYSFFFR